MGVRRECSTERAQGEVEMLFKSLIWLCFLWLMVGLLSTQPDPESPSVPLLSALYAAAD